MGPRLMALLSDTGASLIRHLDVEDGPSGIISPNALNVALSSVRSLTTHPKFRDHEYQLGRELPA